MSRPQVLVVGCGAMGALLAAPLAAVAGVCAFDTDAAQVAAIQADGVRVEGVSARQARIHATDRIGTLAGRRFDAAVFLVKSGATAAALRSVAPVLTAAGARPLLVTLQNGMGPAEALLSMPDLPVARGVSMDAPRYEVAEVRDLIDDMAAECRAVAQALGARFAFDPMESVQQVRQGVLPVPAHAGSMALDIARGADTEIEQLTGYVVREAERLGLPVPTCRAVFRLVKGLEFAARRQPFLPTQTETTRP